MFLHGGTAIEHASTASLAGAFYATTPAGRSLIERVMTGTCVSSAPGYSSRVCGSGSPKGTSFIPRRWLQSEFAAFLSFLKVLTADTLSTCYGRGACRALQSRGACRACGAVHKLCSIVRQ